MRYGVLFSCQDPPGSPIGHSAVYHAALEQVVAAEAQGYEWVNITEHHVAADGYLPAMLPLLAAMAVRTERIRLSTGMLILTLHNPIRIAEEAAVVDILSGGRLTLGVAAGYREIEFAVMQVDYRTRGKRFRESLEILQLAWRGEPFSYAGEIFQFPQVVVRPVPVQRPGIPLWLGGTTPVALRRAVRFGVPCFPGATDDIGVVAQRMQTYDELRAEHPGLDVLAATSPEERLREAADADVLYGLPTRQVFRAARRVRWIHCPVFSGKAIFVIGSKSCGRAKCKAPVPASAMPARRMRAMN